MGAQRREIQKNDLPEAKQALQDFHQACVAGEAEGFKIKQFSNVLRVEKEKIGENGEWNLTGARYVEFDVVDSKYQLLRFNEVCTLEYGASLPKKNRKKWEIPRGGIQWYHRMA